MTVLESLKSVQFLVNQQGQKTAVLLDIQDWEQIINWIETNIDIKIATQAMQALENAGGRPKQAGWLAWDDIREEWDDEEEAIKADSLGPQQAA